MKGRIKKFIINYLTHHLLKAVSEEDILQITSGVYLHSNHTFTQEEIATLKDEAHILKDSFLWKLMTKEVEYIAFLRMTVKAQTPDDIIFGKACFYSIDLMKKFLEGLR